MRKWKLGAALVVLVVMVVAFLDLNSYRNARAELSAVAAAVAGAGEDTYFATADERAAAAAARRAAARYDVRLDAVEVQTGGGVRVTVSSTARSYLAGHVGLRSTLQLERTAVAAPRSGPPPSSATTTTKR